VIAVWMLYCLGIGVAFCVVGYALERALHYAGRPTRWAWVVALAGSYLIPVVAWLRPEAFASFPVAVPAVASASTMTATTAAIFGQPTSQPFALSDLDAPLRWAWVLVSGGMLVAFAVTTARLVSIRRRWHRSVVDGREVLISSDMGPAVVGLWSPRVVLPEWTLALPDRERELMLAHEEQHLRAKDPLLLAGALGVMLVAPWNLALWWQWRRLRLAVEMDCDARVLAEGRSAPLYGELLLRVGERRTARTLAIAAFGEPVSFLESRIRRMLGRLPRWRWVGVAAASIVAVGAIVAACEAPRPLVPRAIAQEPTNGISVPLTSWVRDNIRQFFPTLGDPIGPPLDAYLIHDARLHVYQATLRQRGRDAIVTPDLKRVFPAYDREHDGWGVMDRSMLQGIVRENVRVIWLHHDPQPQDTMPSLEDRLAEVREQAQRLMPQQPYAISAGPDMLSALEADSGNRLHLEQTLEQLRWGQRDDALRALAQQSEPAAFTGARDAIALVIDSDNRLVAHASGNREPGDRFCTDVLTRLLPAYRSARFPLSGCMSTEKQGRVVVYWGQLPKR
jgi:beta-lactamase regulating signal transducer with metallopeptidase domain